MKPFEFCPFCKYNTILHENEFDCVNCQFTFQQDISRVEYKVKTAGKQIKEVIFVNNDLKINMLEFGKALSSRYTASKIRKQILQSNLPVVLNFEGVESISDSFFDELIAVLVQDKGKSWFKDHVISQNLNEFDRCCLLHVINRRLK